MVGCETLGCLGRRAEMSPVLVVLLSGLGVFRGACEFPIPVPIPVPVPLVRGPPKGLEGIPDPSLEDSIFQPVYDG